MHQGYLWKANALARLGQAKECKGVLRSGAKVARNQMASPPVSFTALANRLSGLLVREMEVTQGRTFWGGKSGEKGVPKSQRGSSPAVLGEGLDIPGSTVEQQSKTRSTSVGGVLLGSKLDNNAGLEVAHWTRLDPQAVLVYIEEVLKVGGNSWTV